MNISDLTKMYNFKNKTVIVTGGTGVLGGEISAALAGCNANVAICDLNTELSPDLKFKFKNLQSHYNVYKCDVLSRDSMARQTFQ